MPASCTAWIVSRRRALAYQGEFVGMSNMRTMLVAVLLLMTAATAISGCAPRPETQQQATDSGKGGQGNMGMGGNGGSGGY